MKNIGIKALLPILIMSMATVMAASSQCQAARKAKGVVVSVVQPGEELGKALAGVVKKMENGPASQSKSVTSLVLVQSGKKVSVRKDQPLILKAKDAGKTTGKVIDVVDVPVDIGTLKGMIKDRKCIILWYSEQDGKMAVIQPEKEFMPRKDQQVKLKVKEVAKVEGC